jgi:phenylacetic acid degradation operon negative regulatory protein
MNGGTSVSAATHQHIRGKVSAKSLAIDLLSTMPSHHPVAVAALLRAAAVFGIGENSMRVTLARLRSCGMVESDQRGLYRLSRAALPVNREVRSWSTIETKVLSWDGSFIGIDTGGLSTRDRKGSRVRVRALAFLGFESLTPTLRIRPNNLVGGVASCRERLIALGFSPVPFVFKLAEFDESTDRRARALWDTGKLEADYHATCDRLARSTKRLPSLGTKAAMAESFQLGGAAMRQIVLDPLLPEEIIDVEARSAMFNAMRRYDDVGRSYWKQWTGASIELEQSPVDLGIFGPVSTLPSLISERS